MALPPPNERRRLLGAPAQPGLQGGRLEPFGSPMTRWIAPLVLVAVGCMPESVETVVLTPTTPELARVLRAADARWEAAGVDPDRIQIAEDGAPVRLVPERCVDGICLAQTGIHMQAEAFRGVRWMELYSLDVDVAAHEMGHALGIQFHVDGDPAHDPEGAAACAPDADGRPLMCSHGGQKLTELDVGEACAVGACSGFTAEL